MTREELVEIAKQCGFGRDDDFLTFGPNYRVFMSAIERFARLIAERERDACAKVCEDLFMSDGAWCAKEIRARSEK